jgi:hypothetical protein
MRVFEFRVCFDFEYLKTEIVIPEANVQVMQKSATNNWEEFDCYISNPLFKTGDFLRFDSRMVLKPHLRDSPVREILANFGSFFDLTVEEDEDFQLWVPTMVLDDALDLERGNKIGYSNFDGVVFREDILQEPTIFRLSSKPRRHFLSTGYKGDVDSDFYEMYHQLGLQGLEFIQAWESS